MHGADVNPTQISAKGEPSSASAHFEDAPKRRSTISAGAIGGVVAGLIVTGAMVFGRDAGLLHETLAENAQDWLDRNFETRKWAGEGGTEVLEQVNHLGASAAFGAAYGATRPLTRAIPPVAAGALFGVGLYAVAIAKIAPLIGLTEGEDKASDALSAERLGLHVLFGVVTAIVTDAIAPPPGKLGTRAERRLKAIAEK